MVFRQSGYLDCPGRDVWDVRDVSKFGGTMFSTIRLVGTLWDANIWIMSQTVHIQTISFGHCPIPALTKGTTPDETRQSRELHDRVVNSAWILYRNLMGKLDETLTQ